MVTTKVRHVLKIFPFFIPVPQLGTDNQTLCVPFKLQIIPFEKSAEQAACYYHPDTGCIQSKSLLDIQHANLGLQELLTKDRYWIDITSPSVSEMKMISQVMRTKM